MKRFSPRLLFTIAAGAIGYAAIRALQSNDSFRGKVIVITGGSRGLGLAIARQLAGEGARLVILARDEAEMQRATADLRMRGAADVLALRCDLRQEADIQRVVSEITGRLGAIDVLINNAGEISAGPLHTMTREDFEEMMAIHFHAPLNMILASLPSMLQRGEGRIVNISSFGGEVAVPHLAPYCASKFALTGLSDALRAELAKENVLVTTVCPGLMRTGSHLNAFFKGDHRREFTWFSLGAALPLFSIDANRAARQIVAACRRGQPRLIITIQARLAVVAQALFPNLTLRIAGLVNRLLPSGQKANAREKRTGWESQSEWAPSLLTRLADRATEDLNGLRGHAPPADQ